MPDIRRVLVTGHNGYIGSVMVPCLLQEGYEVVGLDTGYYDRCTFVEDTANVSWIRKDIRDLTSEDLRGIDAVVHLAALSNDPIGNLQWEWTEEINHRASVRLAELAKAAGVQRFLFSSSCIMYGMASAAVVTEESPLDPKTDYARSKVNSEQAISKLADERFSPVFLRNGTIYGVSPRMRFDTVLNDLVGRAVTTKKVTLHSDGKPWRPVVHVRDVARAFAMVLRAPKALVHNQAFNTGADHLNHQIIDLAEIVAKTVPDCVLEVRGEAGADQRTYKADFGKFARTFPDFRFEWTAQTGAEELYETFRLIGLTHETFTDKRFTRLKWLRHLLDSGQVDGSLRWKTAATNGRPCIDGVKIVPLRQIVDERGKIMHMMKATDPHFKSFGEIYFSTAWPGTIKAWHIHQTMTVNNAVVSGRAKLVMYDLRPGSPTKGVLQEVFFGEDNYCLVQIPPGIANGYKAYGDKPVILANCASEPHDPQEMLRLDPFTPEIPYDWAVKHG